MTRCLVFILFACSLPTVYAHSLNLFANYEGDILKGRAYTDTQGLADITVHISDMDHQELGTVTTNKEGHFSFTPPKRMSVECRFSLADGHGAHYTVNVAPSTPPSTSSSDAEITALREQVHHLQEEVHELGHKSGIRDVVGGIGYIIGLAGVAMLIKSKKQG